MSIDTFEQGLAQRAEQRAASRLQSYYRRWVSAERRVKDLERELAEARQKASALRGQVRSHLRGEG